MSEHEETDQSTLREFKIEASDMLQDSEDALIGIEKGDDFNSNFNKIFRCFHSLKGAAGMFCLEELQRHMHKLESLLESQKKIGALRKGQVDYFLAGIDTARLLLDGNLTTFFHIEIDAFNDIEKTKNETDKEVIPTQKNISPTVTTKIDRKEGVVFIVDDEVELVDILAEILSEKNFVIHKFFNGKEAVDSLETHKPDLILSDIMMPVMNGIEMLKRVSEISPNTPVVFLSGNLSKEKMQECLKLGAYTFLDKPFKDTEVLSVCHNAVKKNLSTQLLERSINFILYQFYDIDKYLESQGKESIRLLLKSELQIILEQRKILKKNY